jgi:hypothetical protein
MTHWEARRAQWEMELQAERKFLNAERQRIERRVEELDRIIASMFGEGAEDGPQTNQG